MNNKKLGFLLGLSFILLVVLVIVLDPFKLNVLKNNKEKKYIIDDDDTVEEKVKKLMDNMTFDEKIAQMLILYYTKDTVDDNLKDILDNVKPGGFIITKDQLTTYENAKNFIKTVRDSSEIPMIISVDEEGGNVQRLRNISDKKGTNIPYMYYVGKTNDLDLATNVGKIIAEESRTLGINVVFNPVCDVYSNPKNIVIGKRSFGSNPELVSSMATSVGKGMEDNGVIATYKHFPGHGDTETDSHVSLPILNKTMDDLNQVELIPFKKAIENDAKIMMIGHLAMPKIIGDNTPASLSKTIVTDLLKIELGFKGLVITDALNMGALTKNYSDEEIYTKAIEAGVDLLLMPNGSRNAINYIKKNIREDRVNESVKKILTFKYTYLDKYEYLDNSYLNSKEHQEIINKISIKD